MRKLLITFGALLALVTGTLAPGTVHAGGWAIVSFDPLPELVAGDPATITYTVLQHGVHPVTAEFGGGQELEVTGPDGTVTYPVTATDLVGQFAATIDVPADARELDIAVNWTAGLALQEATIAVPVAPPPSGGVAWAVLGFGALAVFGVALVASAFRSRHTTESGRIPRPQRVTQPDAAVTVGR